MTGAISILGKVIKQKNNGNVKAKADALLYMSNAYATRACLTSNIVESDHCLDLAKKAIHQVIDKVKVHLRSTCKPAMCKVSSISLNAEEGGMVFPEVLVQHIQRMIFELTPKSVNYSSPNSHDLTKWGTSSVGLSILASEGEDEKKWIEDAI
ncbi:hypothetical protein M5689_001145 [Euphorbia peplus]|nr:hypothetical protein M5689_001145 [Euphorbia peplus]